MKTRLRLLVGVTALFLSSVANAKEISTNSAVMQTMDKITGRVNKITIPVNSKISFGDFSLVLRACKKRPAEETPENFAFIDVTDKSFGTDEYNIFRGWIVSSTPGINAIEHPIYDVWLLECTDTEVDEKELLSPIELESRDKIPTKEEVTAKKKIEKPILIEEKEIETKPKVIRIKEFSLENNDIERDIKETPAYIQDEDTEVWDEKDKPQNLLNFTKSDTKKLTEDEDISSALDAEIEELQQY